MTEWRLFRGAIAHVSTAEFHAGRGRAPHLEQTGHRDRLHAAARAVFRLEPTTVVDLGCGDGGLLSLLDAQGIKCWGYDFAPANQDGWAERRVHAELRDVFNTRDVPRWGELAVLTEVLEHLTDPHGVLEWVAEHARWVVASSPRCETADAHADEHAWAWDERGYRALFRPCFQVLDHYGIDWSQLIVAESRAWVG